MDETSASVAKENFSLPKLGGSAPFAFIALLGGNAALASGPLFVRLADVGPVASGFWRLALALPVLMLFALWERRRSERAGAWRGALVLAAVGGLFFASDLASWHIGILQTKMANATLFGNSASLFMAAATLVAARRLPIRVEALALVLAVSGAILLMRASAQGGQAALSGDLLCLLAGILYTGYMLALQWARARVGSWQVLGAATAAGVVPLLLLALALGETIWPHDWSPILLLALTSQLIGQGLLIYALPHFSALVVGLTLLTQPAISALIGWAAYGERLGVAELFGAALVATALVLIRLPARTI
ncbi:MAG: DMT family transporter [Sphingopyxis sp.]